MSGHSLGGLTTLGLIGKHPDQAMKDERIKAALTLSSPAYPFETSNGSIDIPIMIIHGDLDLPRLRPDVLRRAIFDLAEPPKFYIVIKTCGHFAESDAACKNYDTILECRNSDIQIMTINKYAAAFFKRYLRHDLEAEKILRSTDDALAQYEYELK